MPHVVVITVTQLLALTMGVGLFWSTFALANRRECLLGGYETCLLDLTLAGISGFSGFLAITFALILFAAYRK